MADCSGGVSQEHSTRAALEAVRERLVVDKPKYKVRCTCHFRPCAGLCVLQRHQLVQILRF